MTKKKVVIAKQPKKVVINAELVKKVLGLVSKGLTAGIGERKPGLMCVEAAVAYAIGDTEHHDSPRCVKHWLAMLKIEINDDEVNWTSNKNRGLGLRRLAIAQLGSAYVKCDMKTFWYHVNDLMLEEIKRVITTRISAANDVRAFRDVIDGISPYECTDVDDTVSNMRDIYDCPSQEAMARSCEVFVQALIKMKIPGTKFLKLAPVPNFKLFSK